MNTNPIYRAAVAVSLSPQNAADNPFFLITGSASGLVFVRRIVVSAMTLTAAAYVLLLAKKYSVFPATAPAGTTPLVQIPPDSLLPVGLPTLCETYTTSPSGGTSLGAIAARKVFAPTALALGEPPVDLDFATENYGSIVLRGASQAVGLAFNGAPGAGISLALQVEWTQRA